MTGVTWCKFCIFYGIFADQCDSIQQGIRDYHPDYRVMAHSWPAFLYRDERYDPLNPTDGLFKGKLLLKVHFTSMTDNLLRLPVDIQIHIHISYLHRAGRPRADQPSNAFHAGSSEAAKDWWQAPNLLRRRWAVEHEICSTTVNCICSHAGKYNRSLLSLHSLLTQVIQLRFSLSSTGSWRIVDDEFNHQEFYDNIVDFLKLAATSDAVKEVEDLLLWWNLWVLVYSYSRLPLFSICCNISKVFGRKHVSVYRPQRTEQLSVARCSNRH